MENSLAKYIYENFDRIADINEERQRELKSLFRVWNAENIDVDQFRRHFGISQEAGIFTILPFMVEHMSDSAYTRFGREGNLANYIYSSLDRVIDINEERSIELNELFSKWNASQLCVDDVRAYFGLNREAGLYDILPLMVQHADSICLDQGETVKGK